MKTWENKRSVCSAPLDFIAISTEVIRDLLIKIKICEAAPCLPKEIVETVTQSQDMERTRKLLEILSEELIFYEVGKFLAGYPMYKEPMQEAVERLCRRLFTAGLLFGKDLLSLIMLNKINSAFLAAASLIPQKERK